MEYEKIKYPDGQIGAKITAFVSPFEITMSILSYEDLFYLRSLGDVLKYNGFDAYLNINCLFGQRSDRRFDSKESFDLKLIAEIINNCGFRRVSILDPHSDVATALIERSSVRSSLEFVRQSISALDWWGKCTLVAPDAGAYKKVYKYAEELHTELVAAVKHRDRDGNINLQVVGDVSGKNCLVVDDLLDGGYTFHLLATELKKQGAAYVAVYTTHAYFNKGTDYTDAVDKFFCTDSVKRIEAPNVTQFNVL